MGKSIKEKNISRLGESLKGLKELRKLNVDFDENTSSSHDFNFFWNCLGDLKNLKHLLLDFSNSRNCFLTDEEGLSCGKLFRLLSS